jgi:hypothetical protein
MLLTASEGCRHSPEILTRTGTVPGWFGDGGEPFRETPGGNAFLDGPPWPCNTDRPAFLSRPPVVMAAIPHGPKSNGPGPSENPTTPGAAYRSTHPWIERAPTSPDAQRDIEVPESCGSATRRKVDPFAMRTFAEWSRMIQLLV